MCIWFNSYETKIEKAKLTRFKATGRDAGQFSRKVIKEMVTIEQYHCNKYKEDISTLSRAERCRLYTNKEKVVTLDSFIKGNMNLGVEGFRP